MAPRREAYLAGLYGALGVATAALVLFLAYRFLATAVAVSTPFVAALVIALLCDPVVYTFQRSIRLTRGERSRAVTLVFFLFLLGFVALIFVVVPSLIGQLEKLVEWLTNNGLAQIQSNIDDWLHAHRKIGPITLPESIDSLVKQYSAQITDTAKQLGPKLLSAVIGSFSGLLNVVLIPLLTFFLLMDLGKLRRRLIFLLPTPLRRHFVGLTSEVGEVFSNYLRGMMQVSLAYMGVATLLFTVLCLVMARGMLGYVLLVGVVSGALYIVPYVGFLGAALTAMVVALVTGASIPAIIASVALLAILNFVFDNVITPRIVGSGVGVNPIVAMFALLMGASLFGLWGMLLAYPAAGSIQVVLFRLFPKLAQPTPEKPAPALEPEPAEESVVSTDEAE